MGANLKYDDGDKLNFFITGLTSQLPDVEMSFLRRSMKLVKGKVKKHLKRSNIINEERVHMQDDIITRVEKDVYGNKKAIVRGGKKTGTLWHIVNDGTYRTQATHFMDNALDDADKEIETIFEKEMRKKGYSD